MLVRDSAGLAALGEAPRVDEESESFESLSAEKDTPDCLISSTRNKISDCWRFKL
jgi:hypothetical protein